MTIDEQQQVLKKLDSCGELLSFISNRELLKHTMNLIDAAKRAAVEVEENPYRNVIDPFSSLIDAARQGMSTEEWMSQEKARQTQKAFQNAVGDFHQDILGSMPGWVNAGRGGSFDVSNLELKIIAEIKNKHNTMNAGAQLKVYDNLAGYLDFGRSDTKKAYVVQIIPEKPKPY